MANKKISEYTEATSVGSDDLFEISVDLGGGTYETRKVKSSNLSLGSSVLTTKGDLYTFDTQVTRLGVGSDGQTLVADSSEPLGIKWANASGGNTIYTADDALISNRTVDLDSYDLSFRTSSTAYLSVRNQESASGVECLRIWANPSPRIVTIVNTQDGLRLGAYNNSDQLNLQSGATKSSVRFTVIPDGPGGDAHLQVRGATGAGSSEKILLIEATGSPEILKVTNDRQTYTKRLNVTGLGSTSATTALLVENSSSSEAFKILDDLAIIMANLPTSSAGLATGQLWNNSGVVNIV